MQQQTTPDLSQAYSMGSRLLTACVPLQLYTVQQRIDGFDREHDCVKDLHGLL